MSSYLWQNFLTDTKARHYIADKIHKLYNQTKCETIIEIWPWKWALTKHICSISKNFFVIEKDEKLLPLLQNNTAIQNSQIILTDVLVRESEEFFKINWLDKSKTLVVWNLPYYITSPILRMFFEWKKNNFAGGVFLVQDEVWQKLAFDSNKKSYLWWLLNYQYQVLYCKQIPAKAFTPAPKVKSAVIEISMLDFVRDIPFDELVDFLDNFSGFTRKTLGKIQKILSKKWTTKFIIPKDMQSKRLEELSFGDIETILKSLSH